MKVIWRNNKSMEITSKNIGCGSNHNGFNNEENMSLTRVYNHHHISQEQNQLHNKSSKENGLIPLPESGDADKTVCRVCGCRDHLRGIDGCDELLHTCFGVKVVDPSTMICKNCADLILHTQKFKDMVCAAFKSSNEANSVSVKDFESLLSIAKTKTANNSGSEDNFIRRVVLKNKQPKPVKSNKKSIVICCICKQKYPMPTTVTNFICSRCKIKSSSDRTVSCVKCKVVVPSTLMKEHLEMHTKADLKGRCRLRSLTKKPSEAQTTDCVPKKDNQFELQCTRCYNRFNSRPRLEEHMKAAHGEFWKFICNVCGKDMISALYLHKHMKTHSTVKTFDCEICGKIFKSASRMQRHASVHSARVQ